MDTLTLLKKLNEPFGVSGHEGCASAVISALFSEYCDDVRTDALGNVIAYKKCGKTGAKTLMVEAHVDEIGLIVTKVEDDGFLLFSPIGGVDPKILPGCEVVVYGKRPCYGVIGAKPPHLTSSDEEKSVKLKNMAIDTGLKDARTLIRPGDIAVYKTGFTPLLDGQVAGRTWDDRAGLAVIVKMLSEIRDAKMDLCVVATVQEEVGLRGAYTSAFSVKPDCAISIDVTHATSPDADESRARKLSEGPAICLGPNLDRELSRLLIKLAEGSKIPYQLEVEPGDTGTNAWAIQTAGTGVRTLLLSIPERYMHTTFEVINTADVDNTARLIAVFAKSEEVAQCLES